MHTDSGYVAVDEAGRPALHPGRANPEWRKITTAAKVHQFAGTMPAIPAVPQCISAVFWQDAALIHAARSWAQL